MYSSAEDRLGREALERIGRELGLSRTTSEDQIAKWAEVHVAKFHYSRRAGRREADESRVREIDQQARLRVRFFNTAGALLDRRLVDENLLLELIGPAFKRDYLIIRVIVEGNRKVHKVRVYRYVELLKKRYDRWAKQEKQYP